MELAHMILDIARDVERKEYLESCVTIEVVHSIFDNYSCSQWIRLYRPRHHTGGLIVEFKRTKFRFNGARDFLASGCDIILQTMLSDFLDIIQTDVFHDMHYLSMHVYHKNKKLSIIHNYLSSEIYQDHILDNDRWGRDKHTHKIMSNFRRQVNFATKLYY
jgi:hypothetical protein